MNAVKNPYVVEEGSPGTMVGGQHEGRATGEMARAEEDEGGKREQIKAPTSKFVVNEQLEYKVEQHKLHGMLHRCAASVLGATSPGSSSELTQLRLRLWYFPIDLSGWFSVWKGGQQDLGQLEIRPLSGNKCPTVALRKTRTSCFNIHGTEQVRQPRGPPAFLVLEIEGKRKGPHLQGALEIQRVTIRREDGASLGAGAHYRHGRSQRVGKLTKDISRLRDWALWRLFMVQDSTGKTSTKCPTVAIPPKTCDQRGMSRKRRELLLTGEHPSQPVGEYGEDP
ncbi:hypothetical protein DFH09DRAFT_1114074 [Mycena vulgaris]|nr:hypothetical protein DFH09DRAFT_1114074 [Mycena vulgaris]